MSDALLEMENLSVHLPQQARRPLVDRVSLLVRRGQIIGLVGESGSGKSVTARTVLGLRPPGAVTEGKVRVDGVDVLTARCQQVRAIRRSKVAMVFQDARAAINPLRRIGDFLTEPARLARGTSKASVMPAARELLGAVGLPDPERHLRQHPHELSGGMLQRVVIAAALMNDPDLLVCDEPTTALDVTTQAEILAILARMQRERGMGMLFITHDLELAAALCDEVSVMYAGRVVEHAPAKALFAEPRHPYTAALMGATPGVDRSDERLAPVRGAPLDLLENPPGCAFADRCDFVVPDRCERSVPELAAAGAHAVRCVRSAEITRDLADYARGERSPA